MLFNFNKCINCFIPHKITVNEDEYIKSDILNKINLMKNEPVVLTVDHIKGMNIARKIANKSLSNKKKVGCVIIDNNEIISTGFNRVPDCIDNKKCEEDNITYWYVIHAEEDAILKLIDNNIILNNPIMYITLSPCKNCAKLIIQSGIKTIVYDEKYKYDESIELLKQANIKIIDYNELYYN